MVEIRQPRTKSRIKIIPREGELDINLEIDININLDGQVSGFSFKESSKDDDDDVAFIIPDFDSGGKIKFGKSKDED